MKEIIERLERATEGSDELDYDIARAIGGQVGFRCISDERACWFREHASKIDCPFFTTSLDAVDANLPTGYYLQLEPRFDADREKISWHAHAVKPHWDKYNPVYGDWFTVHEGRHSDKYIAANIAALKARADKEG